MDGTNGKRGKRCRWGGVGVSGWFWRGVVVVSGRGGARTHRIRRDASAVRRSPFPHRPSTPTDPRGDPISPDPTARPLTHHLRGSATRHAGPGCRRCRTWTQPLAELHESPEDDRSGMRLTLRKAGRVSANICTPVPYGGYTATAGKHQVNLIRPTFTVRCESVGICPQAVVSLSGPRARVPVPASPAPASAARAGSSGTSRETSAPRRRRDPGNRARSAARRS